MDMKREWNVMGNKMESRKNCDEQNLEDQRKFEIKPHESLF